EALRRYLTVIHVFGPGEHDAYCQYRVGELLAEQGRVAEAAAQWRRLLEQFPRPAPQEYHNRAFDLVEIGPDVTDRPEPHWVARARVRLAQIPQADRKASRAALPSWVPAGALEPLVVTEGDPGKNGKRQVALGDDLLLAGDNEFALRDYLKVMTLCYPSRYMPAASFKLGLCQYMRGDPAAAGREWQQTVAQFPASEWAAYAQVALRHVPAPPAEPATRMPAWQPAYDTWPQRGMSYGLALYRHNLPRFAFKEMIKIIQGEYGPNPLTARARYQAGLAALESGELEAAVLQWRLCRQDYPTSPWSARSQASLDQLVAAGRLPAQALKAPLPAISHQNKPACRQRFNIAEEFFHAGFADDEETALEYLKTLTVTRASPGRYDETVVPAAEARLAQCLEERGHTERAAVHRLKAAQPRTPGGRRGRPRPGK
ncbi:MAG: tetratricopeptide repeat protein, partial [Armatimonadetes bacterium]|nr:tetratricopeptide repeat protein [Armatimonadota bacterium]